MTAPPATDLPLGGPVDTTPRPLPARIPHRGRSVTLEPLAVRHAAELWDAAQADRLGTGWTYLGYGPFPDAEAMRRHVASFAAQHDPMAWAIRPHVSGTVSGWLTLMEIQPANAAIELGHIWFAPALQRSRAATEAMFLLMRHAMDDLGYRRLVWKCNALNAPSRRAAERLGFRFEGELRAHMVVKGRRRDTAFYAMLAEEWPAQRDLIAAWLDDANWDHAQRPRRPLRGPG
ncbi:GNAT family N-acetyltransferase [Falsiroseomonas selenitidurans]|uniref:GNAT family N-acetyltransferase n=1 Tax=Falsiroseomonas selenitidurans TaxID=2716335 RepID=A0ABX1E3X4_9PROT|nr:GNAT family protein [Falsiroseomonas selenitidurans]NKC31894.1 GNAT family N-acetyltransferase [Falsiroseomonas selenitidurans]